ncbi:hypothetical protein C5609_08015 [Pseudomonas putida]|nr:hypothetical protein C5609_08015 [Pseudomonas putida]
MHKWCASFLGLFAGKPAPTGFAPPVGAGLPTKGPEQALQNLASAFISKLLIKSWSNPEQFPI